MLCAVFWNLGKKQTQIRRRNSANYPLIEVTPWNNENERQKAIWNQFICSNSDTESSDSDTDKTLLEVLEAENCGNRGAKIESNSELRSLSDK